MRNKIIMQNKHGFLLRDVVITGVLFTGIMALFIVLIATMANNYSRPDLLSKSFNDHYDKLPDMVKGVDNSRIVITNANSTGLQLTGNVDVAFGSTWNVIALVFSTINLYASMGDSVIAVFPFMDSTVVRIVMYILVSCLLTYIIYSVVSSVMRGRLYGS